MCAKLTKEELIKLVQQSAAESKNIEDFKNKLADLSLQVVRYLLQSTCQMAATDKQSKEASEFISLVRGLYAISVAILKIETVRKPVKNEQEFLNKLTDRIIDTIQRHNKPHYNVALYGLLFTGTSLATTCSLCFYTILRSIVTQYPSLKHLYPVGYLQCGVLDACFSRHTFAYTEYSELPSDIKKEIDDTIERHIIGTKFYLLGNREYGYFSVLYPSLIFSNFVRTIREAFRQIPLELDNSLKLNTVVTILHLLLQMSNVELKPTIFVPEESTVIRMNLIATKVKRLNSIALLTLLMLKFGPKILSLNPEFEEEVEYIDFWPIGLHITEDQPEQYYMDYISEEILSRMHKKFNSDFIKNQCASGNKLNS